MEHKKRSPRMSLADRKAAIVESALPLLANYGRQVSTKQIAQAANISEGMIFKAFPSKEELISAALATAFSPDSLITELEKIDTSQSLKQLLLEIVQVLLRDFEQKQALLHVVRTDKILPKYDKDDPLKAKNRLIKVLAAKLSSHHQEFRVNSACLAGMIFGLAFATTHPMSSHPEVTPEAVVDILLNGIATRTKS